jgi:hypothetical protein
MQANLTLKRGAISTACDLLEYITTNAELEGILIEYGISDHLSAAGSIAKTILALKGFATRNPDQQFQTDFGPKPLGLLLVEEAINRIEQSSRTEKLWKKLERYLNIDGYAFLRESLDDWDTLRITAILPAMPSFAEIPQASDEVDILLEKNDFSVAQRHLTSARDNVVQGDWEAANSQCRTFLEALTDAIADNLYGSDSLSKSGGLQKRQLLADRGFLSRDKHEFGDGNGQTFLPGLARLLHPDGAHPGISTQDDAMFRFQLVVVTAHWLLKRLESNKGRVE